MRNFPTQVGPGGEPVSDQSSFTSSNANDVIQEQQNAITSSGQVLIPLANPADNTQLSKAMARYASGGIWGVESGAANAYVISGTGSFAMPGAYFDGMCIHFRAANASTGPSTINAFAIGVVDLVAQDGSALSNEITTTADTIARYDSGTGDFVVIQSGSGASGLITLGTPVASTSGTLIDYSGSDFSSAKRVTINFSNFSKSGTSLPIVQIGTGGSPKTTGYAGESTYVQSSGTIDSLFTTGFGLQLNVEANIYNGTIILTLLDPSTNTWIASNGGGTTDLDAAVLTNGTVDLAGALDILRITTVGGTDTFDGGKVNITIER